VLSLIVGTGMGGSIGIRLARVVGCRKVGLRGGVGVSIPSAGREILEGVRADDA
jgi:hypothetical protein